MSPQTHAFSRKAVVIPAPERSSLWAFAFLVPIANDETMHPVWVAIERTDALTDKPARELARGIAGTGQTR